MYEHIKFKNAINMRKANYDKFIETITSTGNTYNVDMEVQVKDDNLGKKVSQATADKIGENVYYNMYTSQVEEKLNSKGLTLKLLSFQHKSLICYQNQTAAKTKFYAEL